MRGDNPIVVMAHGCFDVIHAGHIQHLLEAKKRGDTLVVSVTGDEFVGKGLWRPIFTAEQRADHLRALRFVDTVIINNAVTAVPTIERVRPHIYVKGGDYAETRSASLAEEIEAVERCGGRFEITALPTLSSSRLIGRQIYGDAIGDYLDGCRARGFWPRIDEAFAKAKSLKVAFIGETIIDEYRYVSPLGKPSKEFVLAVADQGSETFYGGIIAAARHATKLCNVTVVSQDANSEIRKTRFVGKDFGQKLFETYSCQSLAISEDERNRFWIALDEAVASSDVIVAIDFGHGLFGAEEIRATYPAKFLALNAQSNAANQGFNPVTRWQTADYVCVDAPEARFAAQDQHGPIDRVINALSAKMALPRLIVTHGRQGSYWKGGHVPAFQTSPKDTMGAGDCFLAITAPLIAAGLGMEEAAFVGNIAGAMKTEIVGHREPIDADVLYQSVKSLLK